MRARVCGAGIQPGTGVEVTAGAIVRKTKPCRSDIYGCVNPHNHNRRCGKQAEAGYQAFTATVFVRSFTDSALLQLFSSPRPTRAGSTSSEPKEKFFKKPVGGQNGDNTFNAVKKVIY